MIDATQKEFETKVFAEATAVILGVYQNPHEAAIEAEFYTATKFATDAQRRKGLAAAAAEMAELDDEFETAEEFDAHFAFLRQAYTAAEAIADTIAAIKEKTAQAA